MKRIILVLSILAFMSYPKYILAINITSFPYRQNFDTNAWESTLKWVSGGASASHVTTGCWSGGCAKFMPPTDGQAYSGLGDFSLPSNTRRLNIRALVRVGPTFFSTMRNIGYGHQNKLFIVFHGSSSQRGMTMLEEWEGQYSFGACEDNDCTYWNDKIWNDSCSTGSGLSGPSEYPDQWISVEAEYDLNTATSKVYVFTQDGVCKGFRAQRTLTDTSSYYNQIQILGGFFNAAYTADDNNYIMWDNLVINNTYIGPPEGFVNGDTSAPGEAPSAPGGLRVVP